MPRTLLLADANASVQRIVALTFAGHDMNVVSVNDGEEAIRHIAAEPPDIVLADVAAPARSGYEIAAYVKGRADRAHIPVLLVASAFEPVDQARAKEVRCDGVLVKPLEPQAVVQRVRELVDRPRAIPADDRHDDGSTKVLKHPTAGRSHDDPLGDYLDRLDAAFGPGTGASGATDLRHQVPDIHGDAGDAGVPTLSSLLGETSPPPVFKDEILFGSAPVEPLEHRPAPPARAPRDAPGGPAADAFEALIALDAETRGPSPPDAAITDELVDAVAARIIERLAPEAGEDLVRKVVAEVAERLVREEIDRIRRRK
jgi:CheY-like chemotaxis protein